MLKCAPIQKDSDYDASAIKGVVTFNGLGLTLGLTLVGDVWDEQQLLKKTHPSFETTKWMVILFQKDRWEPQLGIMGPPPLI